MPTTIELPSVLGVVKEDGGDSTIAISPVKLILGGIPNGL
jgi:hypothetical protein